MLDVAFWKEAGEIAIEGRPYRLYREGLMHGAFVLEREGRVVARALKPSAFFSDFALELGDRRYSLKRNSAFGKTFTVFQGDTAVGSIRPASVFSRRAVVELPADWPVPVQVFVFWLVLVIWKRDDGGAAAAAAGA